MYLVSAFIKLSAAAAVLQYRGGDEAAISIMDTQRHSIAVTQNSHLLEDIFAAPLPPWGHLLMLMIQSYRDVGVGCVTLCSAVASVPRCRDQGVTRIMDNSVRISTDKHQHYSLYYLEQIYQNIRTGFYTMLSLVHIKTEEYDFISKNFERLNEFLFVFSFSRRRGVVWKVRFSLD